MLARLDTLTTAIAARATPTSVTIITTTTTATTCAGQQYANWKVALVSVLGTLGIAIVAAAVTLVSIWLKAKVKNEHPEPIQVKPIEMQPFATPKEMSTEDVIKIMREAHPTPSPKKNKDTSHKEQLQLLKLVQQQLEQHQHQQQQLQHQQQHLLKKLLE